jgi:hypothetical protein
MPETPFDNLETAQQYIALLREAVEETQGAVRHDIEAAAGGGRARHLQALRLVDHKLTHLGVQLRTTSRILNDLRMLRRVLLGADDDE